MLFEDKFEEKEEEESVCTFDLVKFEGGAVYLTRDGEGVHIIIGQTYRDHFKRMGELGLLRAGALDLWNTLFGN